MVFIVASIQLPGHYAPPKQTFTSGSSWPTCVPEALHQTGRRAVCDRPIAMRSIPASRPRRPSSTARPIAVLRSAELDARKRPLGSATAKIPKS